jgi:hypothetical protein
MRGGNGKCGIVRFFAGVPGRGPPPCVHRCAYTSPPMCCKKGYIYLTDPVLSCTHLGPRSELYANIGLFLPIPVSFCDPYAPPVYVFCIEYPPIDDPNDCPGPPINARLMSTHYPIGSYLPNQSQWSIQHRSQSSLLWYMIQHNHLLWTTVYQYEILNLVVLLVIKYVCI